MLGSSLYSLPRFSSRGTKFNLKAYLPACLPACFHFSELGANLSKTYKLGQNLIHVFPLR
jgi:hypothetical protein